MGLLGAIEKRQAMASVRAMSSSELSRLVGEYFGGGATASGAHVNSDTAMRLIMVQNCVRMRCATLERVPCHIMERIGRKRNKAEEYYLYDKLLHQPNSWMTAPEFWSMAEGHVCLRGNFYVYKMGLPGRPILELIPLGADAVQEVVQNPDYSLTYKVRVQVSPGSYEIRDLPQDKIFHVRGLTLNGITGLNPIEYARESVGIGMASDKFLGNYFGKGLHPSAVIKHPLSLGVQTHGGLRETLKKKYSGLANQLDFMLLDEGMDITFPQIKLVDAQYLELMKMNEAQICGLFRVPLMLVSAGDKAPTYASAEQFMLFYQTLSVDVVRYESAIRRDLLSEVERRRYYAKFNTNALLRGDFRARMEGYQIGINDEMMSPNEARELEEMNPYEGGDEYRTRTSTVRNQEASGNEKGASQ